MGNEKGSQHNIQSIDKFPEILLSFDAIMNVCVCAWVDSNTVMILKGCKDNFPVPLKCFANDLNNSKEERIALNELNNYAIFWAHANKQSVIIEGNIRQRYLRIRCVHVCSYVYYIYVLYMYVIVRVFKVPDSISNAAAAATLKAFCFADALRAH